MSGSSRTPGSSIAAQLRFARAQMKRAARLKAARDLAEAKDRLRLAELEAQKAGILDRGKAANR